MTLKLPKVIRFKNVRYNTDFFDFSKSLLGTWHIILPPMDYTACGHGTDEYATEVKIGKLTCEECIKLIKFCKGVKL